MITNEHYDSLVEHALDRAKGLINGDIRRISIRANTFNGVSYIYKEPMICWNMYGVIASACLEWAVCNPEKLV
jgi:hypothetical protein